MPASARGDFSGVMERNRRYLPAGVSSTNRIIDPPLVFSRAQGAYLWDVDGKRYTDYHAAFAPYFLGHNFGPVNEAVVDVLRSGVSLFGAGPSSLEGDLAELICNCVHSIDKLCLLNTGTEANSLAIRLSRSITGRKHIIVMQGGYNGSYDELACNLMNSLAEIGREYHLASIRCARLARARLWRTRTSFIP